MSTIENMIREQGLSFSAAPCPENPTMVDPSSSMEHWRCELGASDRSVTFFVSLDGSLKGSGAPSAADAVALAVADIATLGGDPDDDEWLSRVTAGDASGEERELWLGARRTIEQMAAQFGHTLGLENLRALVSPGAGSPAPVF